MGVGSCQEYDVCFLILLEQNEVGICFLDFPNRGELSD